MVPLLAFAYPSPSCPVTFLCLPPACCLAQIQVASIFLVGCPACNHNFKHFFCLLTCSPDQATFANVTAVQPAADTGATAIAEADYFVAGVCMVCVCACMCVCVCDSQMGEG